MDPQNFCPKFASLFSEESLALPPEFDSFCVRHSPANEQVINEEFPGETLRFFIFFLTGHHQDLLVKPGKIGVFFRVGQLQVNLGFVNPGSLKVTFDDFFVVVLQLLSHALEKNDGVSS